MTENEVACQHCGGTGRIVPATYKVGDRVVWKTGSWWGDKPAEVIAVTAKRIRIKTDPHAAHNGGWPWFAYVSSKKLEHALR